MHDAICELKFTGINARTIVEQEVSFPLGQLTTVTGVSGAGKSTLVTHVVGSVVQQSVTTTVTDEQTDSAPDTDRVDVRSVEGLELIQRLVHITKRPIGRIPRSVVDTYIGLFDLCRRILDKTVKQKLRV